MSIRFRLKKGDHVAVISGKYKGQKGLIKSVCRETRKVVVENINVVKRHVKATSQAPGSIVSKELPLPVCKVMLWDASIQKPVRAGMRFEDGEKVRFSRKTGLKI